MSGKNLLCERKPKDWPASTEVQEPAIREINLQRTRTMHVNGLQNSVAPKIPISPPFCQILRYAVPLTISFKLDISPFSSSALETSINHARDRHFELRTNNTSHTFWTTYTFCAYAR